MSVIVSRFHEDERFTSRGRQNPLAGSCYIRDESARMHIGPATWGVGDLSGSAASWGMKFSFQQLEEKHCTPIPDSRIHARLQSSYNRIRRYRLGAFWRPSAPS